jgi:hypothetical protein
MVILSTTTSITLPVLVEFDIVARSMMAPSILTFVKPCSLSSRSPCGTRPFGPARWGKDGEALPLAEGQDSVDDLRGVLALDLLAAPVTEHMAHACKEKPEIIVYLRDGAHGARGFLLMLFCSMLIAGDNPSI